MASAENKTQPTDAAVVDYIQALPTERRREEGMELLQVFERVTGAPAVMWGPSIIGFGTHHYKYDSGREGDEPIVAFSPRKGAISLYGLYSAYVEPQRLHRADLGAVTAGVHRPQPRTHLPRGPGGEGDGQHLAGRDMAVGDQVRDAVSDGAGLARARTGQHTQRPPRGQHGFALFLVEAGEMIGGHRHGSILAGGGDNARCAPRRVRASSSAPLG